MVASHEVQVLGSAMLRQAVIDDMSAIVGAADFYQPRHATVWQAITRLHDAGEPVNALTVGDALARSGDIGRVGGFSALHEIITANTAPSTGSWHAQRVRDASTLRQVDAAGVRLRQLAEDGMATEGESMAAVDAARAELDRLVERDEDPLDHAAGVWAAMDELNSEKPAGDPTPWPELTHAIGGWQPGALHLIAARPKVGKSIAGVMVALHAARMGKHAVVISMEMSRTELYHRMLSSTAEVDGQRILRRLLTPQDRERLNRAAEEIAALPMTVDDRGTMTLGQARSLVREAQRKGPVGVVVVDHIGLMQPPDYAPKHDRRVQVDAISRGLKVLAKDLHVPVVALAQINRGPESRADKMPQPSDLRESGGLEADADMVWILHRDPNDDQMGTTMHAWLGNNRRGPQPRSEFPFQGHLSRFVSYEDAR